MDTPTPADTQTLNRLIKFLDNQIVELEVTATSSVASRIPALAPRCELEIGVYRQIQVILKSTAPAPAVSGQTPTCQHKLTKESEFCLHGYAMGTTCKPCIVSCPECWDMYSSASSFGPRPSAPVASAPKDETNDVQSRVGGE